MNMPFLCLMVHHYFQEWLRDSSLKQSFTVVQKQIEKIATQILYNF